MRKIIHCFPVAALLLLLLTAPNAVSAQVRSVMGEAPAFTASVDTSIVRAWNGVFSVGYIRDEAVGFKQGYFYSVLVDGFDNPPTDPLLAKGWRMPITKTWDIRDMQTHDHYAYFCGRDTATGEGLYGWFDLDSLCMGLATHVFAYRFPMVQVLKRMVHVPSATAPLGGFEAIGEREDALGTHYDCIVEVTDVTMSSYAVVTLSGADDYREVMFDVVVEDGYVVFVGMDRRLANNTLCMRREKVGCVYTGTSIDTLHLYHPAVANNPVLTQLNTKAAPMGNGRFAVVNQCLYEGGIADIEINVMDVHTMNSLSAQRTINQHRVKFHGMKYIAEHAELVSLYDHVGVYSAFLLSSPLQTNAYGAPLLVSEDNIYRSLDLLGNESVQSQAKNHWFLQRCSPEALGLPCLPNYPLWMETIPPYGHIGVYIPNLLSFTGVYDPFDGKVDPILGQINCIK